MKSTPHRQRHDPSRTGRRSLTRIAKRSLRDLSHRFRRLLADLANVHKEPVETTHQLRVTSRRADVALRLFKDWLPRGRRQWMRRVLKDIRFDAGSVRDLDLLERQWRPSHGSLAVQVSHEAAAWMHKRIQAERAQARHRLFHWTKKSVSNRFRKRSQQLVRRARPQNKGSVAARISQALAKLVARLKDSLSTASTSLANSHRTRIHARRLRYALELLHQVLPADTATIVASLVQIQEQLGQINDDATAIRHLKASLEACNAPTLVPLLQSVLEQSESSATARLAKWTTDMSDQVDTLEDLLTRLTVG